MSVKFNENGRKFKTLRDKQQSENPERKRFSSQAAPKRAPSSHDRKPFSAPRFSPYGESAQGLDGTSKVQIRLKNAEDAPKVKKTGALSPRAPEKIRKNRAQEMKIYGENACLSCFEARPEAIVRLWANVEMAKKIGALTHYLAENKKAYHIVDNEELERVTGSAHHGGICLLVKKARMYSLDGHLSQALTQDRLVLLDNVQNAQNIGGVLRACATFGVKNIISAEPDAIFSPASARVAEGGLEFVRVLACDHKELALTQLREAGYQIVHLVNDSRLPSVKQTTFHDKVVFVLAENVAREVAYDQDTNLIVSYQNQLKSGLNIAANAAILLAQSS